MKTKLITRFFLTVALFAFLALSAGNALAVDNKNAVISPYWQSDDSTGTPAYTFIAVSHTSLSGMPSKIGVQVTAVKKTASDSMSDDDSFGSPVTFTIDAGTTKRIFILRTTGSTGTTNILGIDDSSTTDDVEVIVGTATETGFQHGHVLIEPTSSTPNTKTSTGDGDGWPDVTMLSMWGAVVIQSNTTGFAMEFIGDMHDSTMTNCGLVGTANTSATRCFQSGVSEP
jgi:hypothetical protein